MALRRNTLGLGAWDEAVGPTARRTAPRLNELQQQRFRGAACNESRCLGGANERVTPAGGCGVPECLLLLLPAAGQCADAGKDNALFTLTACFFFSPPRFSRRRVPAGGHRPDAKAQPPRDHALVRHQRPQSR